MWYRLNLEEIKEKFQTNFENGLSFKETQKRFKKYGPNKLPEPEGINYFKVALDQIKNPLIYILLVAFVLTIITQDYKDATAIIIVVLINSVIGFIQEANGWFQMQLL